MEYWLWKEHTKAGHWESKLYRGLHQLQAGVKSRVDKDSEWQITFGMTPMENIRFDWLKGATWHQSVSLDPLNLLSFFWLLIKKVVKWFVLAEETGRYPFFTLGHLSVRVFLLSVALIFCICVIIDNRLFFIWYWTLQYSISRIFNNQLSIYLISNHQNQQKDWMVRNIVSTHCSR